MTEAVVTNGTQPAGQHVPEVTRDELHARNGGGFPPVALGPVLPAERDRLSRDVDQARIVDGGAGDVSAQVFERAATGTGGLNMHAPILVPDDWIDLPVAFLEPPVKVLAEGRLQLRQVNEELGIFHAHQLAAGIQPEARWLLRMEWGCIWRMKD